MSKFEYNINKYMRQLNQMDRKVQRLDNISVNSNSRFIRRLPDFTPIVMKQEVLLDELAEIQNIINEGFASDDKQAIRSTVKTACSKLHAMYSDMNEMRDLVDAMNKASAGRSRTNDDNVEYFAWYDSVVNKVIGPVRGAINNVRNGITNTVNSVKGAVVNTVDSVKNTVTSTVNSVKTGVTGVVNKVGDGVKRASKKVTNGFKKVGTKLNNIGKKITETFKKFGTTLINGFKNIIKTISEIGKKIGAVLAKLFDKFFGILKLVMLALWDFIKAVYRFIRKTVPRLIRGTRTFIKTLIGKLKRTWLALIFLQPTLLIGQMIYYHKVFGVTSMPPLVLLGITAFVSINTMWNYTDLLEKFGNKAKSGAVWLFTNETMRSIFRISPNEKYVKLFNQAFRGNILKVSPLDRAGAIGKLYITMYAELVKFIWRNILKYTLFLLAGIAFFRFIGLGFIFQIYEAVRYKLFRPLLLHS